MVSLTSDALGHKGDSGGYMEFGVGENIGDMFENGVVKEDYASSFRGT